jgi:hypothetical protein
MGQSPRTSHDTVDRRESEADAYIPVHITEEPRGDGRVLVYLSDGTGLLVHRRNLVPHHRPPA